ncbi:acyltransferase family protein [Intrasporangium calvum]|uniref:Acyltransferase 3 n=1 Tax=Intrasporangium calvum (strain ATCC 23552 / DSM 43043 / JCM 3097 / NBRC 12989 / NCIMB 10167 / NRRL B-3866 / 7 KIP) TaxID=710696 RepID=E6S8V3_INTC7|nr:acyltransferase family protein [Intrasporangium calvum]ADU48090.1 acyltransferase 3 [Intrasporangium calvum DSM 43043]
MQHSRNRDLDGVRGLAILLVVAAHSGLPIRWGGLSGVTLFFVLSGYLITSLLIREWDRWGSVSLWRFWGRRALRLLPALLVFLALVPLLLWATGDSRLASYPAAAMASLFYVGNWVRIAGTDLGVLNHLWSLSVEEQFYVVWPLVFLALMAWWRQHLLGLVLGLTGVATVYSVWATGSFIRLDISTETNAFALLLGVSLAVALASIARKGWHPPRVSVLIPFTVMILVSAFPSHDIATDHGLFRPLGAVYAVLGVWLVASAVLGHSPVVASPVMVFFGTISYALYLWHQALINSVLFGDKTVLRNLALIAAAVVLSWLSWVVVERPAGRLRGRLRLDEPSRRQLAARAVASVPSSSLDPRGLPDAPGRPGSPGTSGTAGPPGSADTLAARADREGPGQPASPST